jgi:hypothetical protein
MRKPGLRPRAWRWWPPPPSGVVGQIGVGCGDLPNSHLVLAASWGGMAAGESRALTSVIAWRCGCIVALLKASSLSPMLLAHAALGETPDLGILDRTMAALLCVVLPLGACFWSSYRLMVGSGVHLPRR